MVVVDGRDATSFQKPGFRVEREVAGRFHEHPFRARDERDLAPDRLDPVGPQNIDITILGRTRDEHEHDALLRP